MSKIPSLHDEVLPIIFSMLNLNDRAPVRLVNKQFKNCVDRIKIKKLIIYQDGTTLPIKLSKNLTYSLNDTVRVVDFQKFFSNQTIINSMKSIHTLVILGYRPNPPFELNVKFDKLIHLELSNVLLQNSGLFLNSLNLEIYVNDYAYFKSIEEIDDKIKKNHQTGSTDSHSIFMYDFKNLMSKKIKFFSFKTVLDHNFLVYCVRHGLFAAVEEMDITIERIHSLLYLNDNCPSLKSINLKIGNDLPNLLNSMSNLDFNLEFLTYKLRKDLAVFLFGIPFNYETAGLIFEFLCEVLYDEDLGQLNIRFSRSRFEVIMYQSNYTKIFKKYEQQLDLTGFYKSIGQLHVGGYNGILIDAKLNGKLQNLDTFCVSFFESPNAVKFKKIYDSLTPNLKSIWFRQRDVNISYDNRILDPIPTKFPNLIHLSLDNRNDSLNFNFIYKLTKLNFLKINLGRTFDSSVFLNILKKLKNLDVLDVRFIKPSILNKDKLKEFKALVNKTLNDELNKPNHEFKIRIVTRRVDIECYVRYLMKHKEVDDFMDSEYEELKLYQWSMMKNTKDEFLSIFKHSCDVWFLNIDPHFKSFLNKAY